MVVAFKAHQGGEGQEQDRRGKREERDEGGELKWKEQARLQRERQDTGAVCSQLCLEMNVTAMLTLANTPAPPQIQALGPAMAPRATKLEPGQEAQGWVYTDPTARLQPWLSSSIPSWDLGGGAGKGAKSAWPEQSA